MGKMKHLSSSVDKKHDFAKLVTNLNIINEVSNAPNPYLMVSIQEKSDLR